MALCFVLYTEMIERTPIDYDDDDGDGIAGCLLLYSALALSAICQPVQSICQHQGLSLSAFCEWKG